MNEEKKHLLFGWALFLFSSVLLIGSVGYYILFEPITWVDAFLNASLIMTSIDIERHPVTDIQKIFVSLYSLLAVFVLLSLSARAFQDIISLVL